MQIVRLWRSDVRVSIVLVSALACSAFGLAQVSNPPGAAAVNDAAREEPIELSPFTVSSTQDRGYQAQSSLGGSRLKTNLKDVAAPTSASQRWRGTSATFCTTRRLICSAIGCEPN